jgi:rhodanese-related sulfurtransferase
VEGSIGTIGRDALWEKIERGDAFVLVDAFSPMSYAVSHLPGAINIPIASVDERARRRLPDHDIEIVVYCASVTCDSSVQVAHRLVELGYRNVYHYAEGKSDWVKAGLPLEGGRVAQADT